MGEQFRSFDNSKTGPGEIGVCVNCIDAPIANSRKVRPAGIFLQQRRLLDDLIKIEPARRNDQNFRRPLQHIVPGNANGISTRLTKSVNAAGNLHHLGHPVSTAIDRIERILDNLAFDLSPFFLQRAWTVYEDMIALCLSQGEAERAFGYLERARSMALRQYRNRRPGEAASESTGTMLSGHAANMAQIERTKYELKTWQDRYRKYSSLASQVDASLSLEVDSSIIEAELKRCEAKVGELFEHLYLQQATTAIPRQHRRGRKSSATSIYPDAAQLRRRLAPGQLLLAYFLYYGRLVIFALT